MIRGVKMKKIVYIVIIIFLLLNLTAPTTKANEEETLEEQQEEFGISEFIEKAQNYSGKFFEDMDMNEILNSAIKGEVDNQTFFQKILNLLGGELVDGLTVLGSILAIVIIHSILKSVSESL